MTISTTDIKLRTPERLTDLADGGLQLTTVHPGTPRLHAKSFGCAGTMEQKPFVTLTGCGFTTRLVCVFVPASNARTIGAENRMGRDFMTHPHSRGLRRLR